MSFSSILMPDSSIPLKNTWAMNINIYPTYQAHQHKGEHSGRYPPHQSQLKPSFFTWSLHCYLFGMFLFVIILIWLRMDKIRVGPGRLGISCRFIGCFRHRMARYLLCSTLSPTHLRITSLLCSLPLL